MRKSLNLIELKLLQMLIPWQHLQENDVREFKKHVNLLHKGPFKYKCLLNIYVFLPHWTTKHLFYTDH